MSNKKYNDAAYQYCQQVLSEKIIACNKIKQMAKRNLNDLERQGNDDFPYYWDTAIAKKADVFIQAIPDVDRGIPIPLALYQRALFQMVLAWRRIDGGKRWSKGVFSVSRHNGKTQFAANLATFEFLFGTPKHNRQIICAGQSNETANHILSYSKDELPYILNKLGNEKMNKLVSINEHEIKINGANTFMKKLSSESKSLFGFHPTFVACDEYHTMKDRSFVQKLSSGMLFNKDALFLIISTCGSDLKSPMYQDHKDLWTPILDGQIKQDDYFVAIYEQDSDDEAFQPDMWEKSNPLFAIKSVKDDSIDKFISERDVNIKQDNLSKFINQNMNRWKSLSDRSLISSIEDWNKATLTNFDANNRDVYIGLDLGKTNDNSSAAFIFPYLDENRNQKWHIKQHSFIGIPPNLGIEGKEKKDGIMYRNLERKGECSITTSSSGYIDYDFVFQYICDFVDEHHLNVISVNYDKYAIANIINKIENDPLHDWEVVSVGQLFKDLKDPTNQFLMLFGNGQITHDDDEMLNAAFSNAVLLENDYGMKIDKYNDRAGFRIDPADATINTFVNAGFYFNENHDSSILPISGKTNEELNNFFQSSDFSF